MKGLICLFFIIRAYAFVQEALMPGGLAVLEFDQKPTAVTFKNHKALILPHQDKYVAILGLGLHFPLLVDVQVDQQDLTHTRTLSLLEQNYPTEHLSVDKKKGKIDLKRAKRIQQEKEKLEAIFNIYSATQPDIEFVKPAEGRTSSPFGYKRIFNKERHSVHRGLDYAAPQYSPIVAASGGTVVLAEELYLSGNTVVIDHGAGLYTLYGHMDTMSCKISDVVSKGQVLGTIGKTGVVTGPHLHFTVSLSGVRVNPALFFKA